MNAIAIQNEFYPFIYGQQVRLKEACWINKEPWFTRRSIGEWLEYALKIRDRAISKIIERNPHIDQFSTLVNLTSVEGSRDVTREVRVYNPIGLQLIIFESRQPKAKAYKIAVAHLVQAFMRGEVKPPWNPQDARLQMECEEALKLPAYSERPTAIKTLVQKYDKGQSTIYGWMQRLSQGENPSNKLYGNRVGKRAYLSPETEAEIQSLVLENPDVSACEIIRRVPRVDFTAIGTVYRIMRKIKEQSAQAVSQPAWR